MNARHKRMHDPDGQMQTTLTVKKKTQSFDPVGHLVISVDLDGHRCTLC